ncbi:hypothetical protein IPN35_03410 [Candidatus Peregrinibacteria bacterium]|nr:MAG: hypothetical protein IPN35_03410 [Candidatus Peregrinibacteria bacterium]
MSRYGGKKTAEGLQSISIVRMKQWGFFNEKESFRSGSFTWGDDRNKTSVGYSFSLSEKELRLQYSFVNDPNNPKAKQDYKIRLSTSSCRYGGVRYWIHCPRCERRVGKLYLAGKYVFACRQCWNLTYSICNASGLERRIGKFLSYCDLDEEFSKLKRWYHRGITSDQYDNFVERFSEEERELQEEMMTISKADNAFLKTSLSVLELAQNAGEIFKSSKPEKKSL